MKKLVTYTIFIIFPFLEVSLLSVFSMKTIYINIVFGLVFLLYYINNKYIYIYALYAGLFIEYISYKPLGIISLSFLLTLWILNFIIGKDSYEGQTFFSYKTIIFILLYEVIRTVLIYIITGLGGTQLVGYNVITDIISNLLGIIIVMLVYSLYPRNVNEKRNYLF